MSYTRYSSIRLILAIVFFGMTTAMSMSCSNPKSDVPRLEENKEYIINQKSNTSENMELVSVKVDASDTVVKLRYTNRTKNNRVVGLAPPRKRRGLLYF